jgi:hypothetical protein
MKRTSALWLLAASVIVCACSHGATPSDAALEVRGRRNKRWFSAPAGYFRISDN